MELKVGDTEDGMCGNDDISLEERNINMLETSVKKIMEKVVKPSVDNGTIIDILCDRIDSLNMDMVTYNNIKIPNQPREREDDNREYKLYLDFNGCRKKFENRSTQLLHRLITGDGKALYIIGLYDDGTISGIEMEKLISSIDNICKMAKNIKGIIRRVSIYDTQYKGKYVVTIRLYIPSLNMPDDMFIY